MSVPADEIVRELSHISCTNLSDAMDALGIAGAITGLRPLVFAWERTVGRAVTIKLGRADAAVRARHIGVAAIESAKAGDILVIDNQGRTDSSCFGGVLATAAKHKGVVGVVADGVCRDLEDYEELGFAAFARGTTIVTARSRSDEVSTNEPVQCCGVTVYPGDYVVADKDGVVAIPQARVEQVLRVARAIAVREQAMLAEIRAGRSIAAVDSKYAYNAMLSEVKDL